VAETEIKRMLQRYGEQADWQHDNPVLYMGEIGVEHVSNDDYRFKFGDGLRQWMDLPYAQQRLFDANVTFFFNGRAPDTSHNIEPEAGDYDASMIAEVNGLVWFTQAERDKLAGIDPRLLLPLGGTAEQRLRRASSEPYAFDWTDPGATPTMSTRDLTDVDATPPTEGQSLVLRAAAGSKYKPETPTGGGGSTRIKKLTAPVRGQLTPVGGNFNIVYPAIWENKQIEIDLSTGDLHLQFDNSISHGLDEIITTSLLTRNYDPSLDYRVYFESKDALVATAPALQQLVVQRNGTGVSGTALSAGPGTATVTITPGNDVAVFVTYVANPADTAQPTLTSGVLVSVAGAAAVEHPWTNTRGNQLADQAGRATTYEIAIGNVASNTVYTFKPVWRDALNNIVTTANVNAYATLVHVFTGADQIMPFENQHPNQYSGSATTRTTNVVTDGPSRLCVHTIFRRNNTGDAAITCSAGFTVPTGGEGTTQSAQNNGNMRYMTCHAPLTTEGVSTNIFNLVNNADSVVIPFAVRPSVVTGMVVHINSGKVANIGGNDVLATIMYDANLKRVDISY
jgi:hypothetical protein